VCSDFAGVAVSHGCIHAARCLDDLANDAARQAR
jgi:hypothetical protein